MDIKKRVEDLENSLKELEEERIAKMSNQQKLEHYIGIVADALVYDPELKGKTSEERRQWLRDYLYKSNQNIRK